MVVIIYHYTIEGLKSDFSLFSVGSLVTGFADPGNSPQIPGIYRFHAKTKFSRKESKE
ncbi:MAG: hypothetical protein KAV87_54040 [Desulfobacteraceae bacterium]|nr:hypothetical protein [Desulfobacteraceae bacterium]